VARVSHHITNHTTLLSKILAVFTPLKDNTIQTHLGAYCHLLCNSPETVDIPQVINTVSMLLTSFDESHHRGPGCTIQHPSFN
jgi:hypothetical protein